MKKHAKMLCIGLLVVACAVSLFLCACGKKPDDIPPVVTATKYTVTYDLGGGQGTAPAGGSYEQGATFTLAAATGMTKDGYKFDKWNDGTTDYDAGATYTMPAKNVTFTAKWTEKKEYTVTFDMNGYGMPIAAKTVKEDDKVTAPTAPEALYVTFDGWYTDNTFATAFDFDAGITSDGTAYAKWTADDGMPRGYSSDRAKNVREKNDPDRMADYIADGTTLYYTYTATATGRYAIVFEEVAASKIAYAYTVSGDGENLKAVDGEQSLCLNLAEGQTVNLVVNVKEGVSLPLIKPIDGNVVLGVYVAVSDDEPLLEGQFGEGVYVGRVGVQDVYFRITNRAKKEYTIAVGKEGSKVCTFKHVLGVVTLTDTDADWGSGVGTMTWNDESKTISFISGEGATATLRMWDAENLPDLISGANSGTVNAELGYAYFRVPETKSYKFTDATGLTFYGDVLLASPSAVSAWTVLESGEAYDFAEGDVIAVKAASGSAVSFTATALPLLGTAESNPIVIRGSVDFVEPYQINTMYYFKFVALEDGEYKFYTIRTVGRDTYKGQSTYTGFQANGTWYNYNAGGNLIENSSEYTATLQAGDEVAIAVIAANASATAATFAQVTLKIDVEYDLSNPTALTFDENYNGSVDTKGNYTATITDPNVIGLVFTSDKAMDIILGDGVKHGNKIELTTAQMGTAFKILCTASVQYAPVYRLGIESNPYVVSGNDTQTIEYINGGAYVEYTAVEAMSFRFGVNNNWTIKVLSDEQEETEATSALVLNLQKDDVVRFLLTPAENSSNGTTFEVSYDFVSDATNVSFAEDSHEALAANANYKISAVDSTATSITFTANDAFVIKFADGSDSIVGIAGGSTATVTVEASKLKSGAYFRLTGEDVQWTVAFKEGSAKNPYVVDVIDGVYTRDYKKGEVCYVKITAPANSDVIIQPYYVKDSISRFLVVGSGRYYGFSNASNEYSTDYEETYTLAAGNSVVIGLSLGGELPGWTSDYGVGIGVWYSYANDNASKLDTSSVENHRVYTLTDAEIEEVTFTASSQFAFTNVASVSCNSIYIIENDADVGPKSDRIVVQYAGGKYSYTVRVADLGKFAIDFMGNDEVTCAVTKYALGSVNAPQAVTLGETSVRYTKAYADGKYYLQVTVPDAGKYLFALGSSAFAIADLPENGEVEFAEGELSKTFVVTGSSSGTFTLNVSKVLVATNLEFGMEEGAEGAGTTVIESGNAYTVGSTITDADNDKFVYAISFTSSAAFTIAYSDSADVVTAELNDGVYKAALEPEDARRTLIITGNAAIAYAVDWIEGCVYNPIQVTAGGDIEIDYTVDKVVYLQLSNNSQYGWKVTVPSGYTVSGDVTENTFTVSAGDSKSITVTDVSNVVVTIGVLNDYAVGAQTLAFDEDGFAIDSYINVSAEGKTAGTYIVGETVVEGDLNDDIEGIIFSTRNAMQVTLYNGEVLTGFRAVVSVQDMRRGVLVEGSDIGYGIAWVKGSQSDPAEIVVGENLVPFRAGHTSYAIFTVDREGYYTFNAKGFTVKVDGEAVTADEEVQLNAYALVEIEVSGDKDVSVVPLTIAYSAVSSSADFPDEMMGEWTFSGMVKDYWDWDSSVKVTLTFSAGRNATYKVTGGASVNTTLVFTYSNGTYTATYANGSNTYTVTVWFENGVVSFSDSYNAKYKYEMIKAGSGVELPTYINDSLKGTWSCRDDNGFAYIIEIGEKNQVHYVIASSSGDVFTDVTGTMSYNKDTDTFELREDGANVDLTAREDWGTYTLTLFDSDWMDEAWTMNRSFSLSSVGTWAVSDGGYTATVTIGYGTVHYSVTQDGQSVFDETVSYYDYNIYTQYFNLYLSGRAPAYLQESEWGLTLEDDEYLTEPMVLTKQ